LASMLGGDVKSERRSKFCKINDRGSRLLPLFKRNIASDDSNFCPHVMPHKSVKGFTGQPPRIIKVQI
jgi:hypothetical protein